jgi:hypothetical protein
MHQQVVTINCQNPPVGWNINRNFQIVQCVIENGSEEFNNLQRKANDLANLVNDYAANNSTFNRLPKRKAIDAFGGVLAEEGWMQFINSQFGAIAFPTQLEDINEQIDIQLLNGEKLEVRSSFPRNGVKFGICNNKFNFKNIGPYSNTVKPGEVQKEFYLAVLFDTQKRDLFTVDEISFSLIGGSTWDMMMQIGYDDPLKPLDDLIPIESTYRVIQLQAALDAIQIIVKISESGYTRK